MRLVFKVPSFLDSQIWGRRRYSCCREFTKEGGGAMNTDIYTKIGIIFVWCMKFIFIPLGIAISARIIADKLTRSHPERQRKKRSFKNRSN